MRRGRATTTATLVAAAVAPLLALAALGCPRAAPRTGTTDAPADSAADESTAPVTVTVENRNHLDVVVYAVHEGGVRQRLGLVTSGAVGRFNLARRTIVRGGDLYLIAHPVGSTESYASDRVNPQPGQRVFWTLQQGFERSSIVVQ